MGVYEKAEKCLPEGARLKLDRAQGLYMVRLKPEEVNAALNALRKNGFLATVKAELLTISPGRAIIDDEARRTPAPVSGDHLYRQLCALAGRDICQGEIDAYIKALKGRLYSREAVETALRRQAAECMRKGCGGLLHAIRYLSIND